MKMRFLLAASLLGSVGFAAEARPQPDFLAFKPAAQPFGLVDAERLASVEFRRLYGACGMTIFKERRFEAWIFETRIGYAGVKGPDLVVFSTAPGSVVEMVESLPRKKLRDMLEPMPERDPLVRFRR